MTTLIVDDEPLARVRLRRLLEEQGVQVVGEAEDATEALQKAEDLSPDLVLLDIQMPGMTGMQMASALLHVESAPLVVFVTGYAEHAVAAFQQDALDYLVKPVLPDRLAQTLARARERLADRRARQQVRRKVMKSAAAQRLRRLPVRLDYVVRLLPVEEIVCAVARDKRVYVRTRDGKYPTYYTLKQLETLLPADLFLRTHESSLINLEAVTELLFLGNHSYQVRLSTNECLPVARSRYAELQRRLGVGGLPPS